MDDKKPHNNIAFSKIVLPPIIMDSLPRTHPSAETNATPFDIIVDKLTRKILNASANYSLSSVMDEVSGKQTATMAKNTAMFYVNKSTTREANAVPSII